MEPMRGDAFIHFVYGSRRVNIRLGVLLLIPKSPHIVAANIRLSLRRNTSQKNKTAHYYWSLLNNSDINNKYAITLRNKFDARQKISETLTPNYEYENFVNAHMEVAAECIPTKLRAKHRVPWKTLTVKKKVIPR